MLKVMGQQKARKVSVPKKETTGCKRSISERPSLRRWTEVTAFNAQNNVPQCKTVQTIQQNIPSSIVHNIIKGLRESEDSTTMLNVILHLSQQHGFTVEESR